MGVIFRQFCFFIIGKFFLNRKIFAEKNIFVGLGSLFATDDVLPRGGGGGGGGHFFLVLRRRNGASREIGKEGDGNGRLNVVITLN